MTPEELAAELDRLAQAAAERADDTGGEQSQINIGRCRAYTRSAALVREHLCTPHAEVEALRAEIQRLRAGLFGVRALIADCSGIPPLRNSLEQLVLAEIDAIAIGGTTP